MTVIRNRRPWLTWGLAAFVLGATVLFTIVAFTGGGAGRAVTKWSQAACNLQG